MGLLTAGLLAGSGRALVARYQAYREETRRLFLTSSVAAAGACINDRPVVVVSGSVPGIVPPLQIVRDGDVIGRIDVLGPAGDFEYFDERVAEGESHVYAVAKAMPVTGDLVTSPSVGTGVVPRCRNGNRAPEVSEVEATPMRQIVGQPIRFKVSASDPEGDPLTVTWTFDDGTLEQRGTSVQHVFESPGWHYVRATVSDGYIDAVQRDVRVGVMLSKPTNMPPKIRGVFVGPSPVRPNERVRVVALADDPDGDTLMYEWSFGNDVATSERSRAAEVPGFARAGTYAVSVRVSDSALATVEATAAIVVDEGALPLPRCEALTVAPGVGLKVGEKATFTATGLAWDGGSLNIDWDFGDGASVERSITASRSQVHVFEKGGIYDVVARIRQKNGAADVCYSRVVVGNISVPVLSGVQTGRVIPESGTTDTQFELEAAPPGLDLTGCRFRWTLRSVVLGKAVILPDVASPRIRQRFPGAGVWSVGVVVIMPGGAFMGPYDVGTVTVRTQRAIRPPSSGER